MKILQFIKSICAYAFLISMDYLVMIKKFLSGFIFGIGLLTIVLYIAGLFGIGDFYFIYGEGWNCIKGIKE